MSKKLINELTESICNDVLSVTIEQIKAADNGTLSTKQAESLADKQTGRLLIAKDMAQKCWRVLSSVAINEEEAVLLSACFAYEFMDNCPQIKKELGTLQSIMTSVTK